MADVRAGGAGCFRCTAGRGARSVDSGVGGLHGTAVAAHGGAAPIVAVGVVASSGSERGSRSGDGDEAKLRGRAPAAGCLLIFFVCQKYFGTGWKDRYQ